LGEPPARAARAQAEMAEMAWRERVAPVAYLECPCRTT
jgi:hypothetical protein